MNASGFVVNCTQIGHDSMMKAERALRRLIEVIFR